MLAASNAKPFVGSYAGTLALLYRTNYPSEIFGAYALSPVTKGLVSDPKDPIEFGFGDWVCIVSSVVFHIR